MSLLGWTTRKVMEGRGGGEVQKKFRQGKIERKISFTACSSEKMFLRTEKYSCKGNVNENSPPP